MLLARRSEIINQAVKIPVLLGVLIVLITVLSFGTGCGQSSDQSQALEEQQQENEELQRRLDAQEKEQEEAVRQQEAAEREELQRENEELQKELEAQEEEQEESESQESEPQESEPEPESDSPDVVIETAPPSQAPQGVVAVSPDYDVQAVTTEEAEAINAAIAYYQEVEVGDYYATHSLLSEYDKTYFPVDTWVQANTVLDSAAGEFVVTDAYPEDLGNGSPAYAVTVAVYLTDGSSSYRTTYFTDEGNGYWAHWLSDEEMDLFNSAL